MDNAGELRRATNDKLNNDTHFALKSSADIL